MTPAGNERQRRIPEPVARWFRWTRVLAAYFSWQGLTQALGLVAGLLVVRWLPVDDFALYTLATSVVTFFGFATDFGSTGSLIFFFQDSRQSGVPFQRMVRAVFSLRRLAFGIGAILVLLGFPWLAMQQGFPPVPVLLATAGILAAVWFQLGASLALLTLRLADRMPRAYGSEAASSVLRLVGTVILKWAQALTSWSAVLLSAAGAALMGSLARKGQHLVTAGEDSKQELASARRRVLRYLAPTLPAGLYFSFQGVLIVWLATVFGQNRTIAEVGALGRLGLIVGLVSSLPGVVLLPKLARLEDDGTFRRRVFQFAGLIVLLCSGILALGLAFPSIFLALVGSHYRDLEYELGLTVGGAALRLLGSYFGGVNTARSWTRWIFLAVILEALAQVLLIALLDLSTTASLLWFTILGSAVGLSLQVIILVLGLRNPRWVRVVP